MLRGIGNRLKSLRLRHKLSQTEMGNRVGTSFNTIQRLEKGETGVSFNVLANISREFGLSLDYIVFGGDPDFSQTEDLQRIMFKLNHDKPLDNEEKALVDKLFFFRMEQIHQKRLLTELSEQLNDLSEDQLASILRLLSQLTKLEDDELKALIKLFS